MNLDIRTPMGLMFLIIGTVIAVFGMASNGNPMYAAHSLGININLWWGLVMAAFGAVMLLLAWNAARKHAHAPPTPGQEPPDPGCRHGGH